MVGDGHRPRQRNIVLQLGRRHRPTFTLIAQDTAASAWAVATAITTNAFTVTVTGAASETINWAVVAGFYEVAG